MATATAASTALPPWRRTARPASVAKGDALATIADSAVATMAGRRSLAVRLALPEVVAAGGVSVPRQAESARTRSEERAASERMGAWGEGRAGARKAVGGAEALQAKPSSHRPSR